MKKSLNIIYFFVILIFILNACELSPVIMNKTIPRPSSTGITPSPIIIFVTPEPEVSPTILASPSLSPAPLTSLSPSPLLSPSIKSFKILKIEPSSGTYGDYITITGENFKEQRGSVVFTYKDSYYEAFVSYWSDTKIVITGPNISTNVYKVIVKANGMESNSVDFSLINAISYSNPTTNLPPQPPPPPPPPPPPTPDPKSPTITSFDSSTNFVNKGGSGSIIINGTNFIDNSVCQIIEQNGEAIDPPTDLSTTYNSSSKLIVQLSSNETSEAGKIKLQITNTVEEIPYSSNNIVFPIVGALTNIINIGSNLQKIAVNSNANPLPLAFITDASVNGVHVISASEEDNYNDYSEKYSIDIGDQNQAITLVGTDRLMVGSTGGQAYIIQQKEIQDEGFPIGFPMPPGQPYYIDINQDGTKALITHFTYDSTPFSLQTLSTPDTIEYGTIAQTDSMAGLFNDKDTSSNSIILSSTVAPVLTFYNTLTDSKIDINVGYTGDMCFDNKNNCVIVGTSSTFDGNYLYDKLSLKVIDVITKSTTKNITITNSEGYFLSLDFEASTNRVLINWWDDKWPSKGYITLVDLDKGEVICNITDSNFWGDVAFIQGKDRALFVPEGGNSMYILQLPPK